MRFALEHQNPFMTGTVTGGAGYPETQYSLLTLSEGEVVLWALKPAEEGIEQGVILRVWNLAHSGRPLTVSVPGGAVTSAGRVTQIETDMGDATVVAGVLSETIPARALRTFRLRLRESSTHLERQ